MQHKHFKKMVSKKSRTSVILYILVEGTAHSKTVIFWLSELYCVLLKVTLVDCTNTV